MSNYRNMSPIQLFFELARRGHTMYGIFCRLAQAGAIELSEEELRQRQFAIKNITCFADIAALIDDTFGEDEFARGLANISFYKVNPRGAIRKVMQDLAIAAGKTITPEMCAEMDVKAAEMAEGAATLGDLYDKKAPADLQRAKNEMAQVAQAVNELLAQTEEPVLAMAQDTARVTPAEGTVGVGLVYNEPEQDVTVANGNFTSTSTAQDKSDGSGETKIVAKSVVVKDAKFVYPKLRVEATGDVLVQGASGVNGRRTQSPYMITSNGNVLIKDCNLKSDSYNNFVFSANGAPKSITFDNVNLTGYQAQCAFQILNVAPGCVITFKHCTVYGHHNFMRFSNVDNVSGVKIQFIESHLGIYGTSNKEREETFRNYNGYIILDDYTSANVEEFHSANRFGPDKLSIDFLNCTYWTNAQRKPFNFDVSTEEARKVVINSRDPNQIIYTGFEDRSGETATWYEPSYNEQELPVVNITYNAPSEWLSSVANSWRAGYSDSYIGQ